MIEKRGSIRTDLRTEVWLVSQFELEHLRRVRVLDTHQHTVGPTEANLDDLLTRLDVSQLPEIAGLDQTIGQMITTLQKIDPVTATLHKEDSVTYRAIR